jgi:hypothetical protein
MPYASDKQKRLMQAVAHNPGFAKKVGIPQSVGQKFEAHKAGGGMAKKLFGGKETYAEELKEAKAIKSGKISPQQYARGEQKEEAGMKKAKSYAYGGPMVAAPGGGNPALDMALRRANVVGARGAAPAAGQARMAKGGVIASKMGSVKTAAPSRDGIASKGKTKGTMVKMAGNKGMKRGGKC